MQITQVPDSAAADTTSSIELLNQDLAAARDRLLTGEFDLFLDHTTDALVRGLATFLPRLVVAIITLLLFWGLYRLLFTALRKGLTRSKHVQAALRSLALQGFRAGSILFIGVLVLGQLGFSIATLVAGLGIAGIAVGFAARDTLENVLAGMTILLDGPFRIGDQVYVQDIYGTVTAITLRSTRIRTQNNKVMIVPNTNMVSQRLINHSMAGLLRVEIPFGIAYREYPQEARHVVLSLTQGDTRLDAKHPPNVVVRSLNDSSIDMELWLWVRDSSLEERLRSEYTERIREGLREADIEIPFPHIQLKTDAPLVN